MESNKVPAVIVMVISIIACFCFSIALAENEKTKPNAAKSEEAVNGFKEYMEAEETPEEKEIARLYRELGLGRKRIDMHGLDILFGKTHFVIFEGHNLNDKSTYIYESEIVKDVHYTGDEFLVLQYEGVLKEFSTKERKLTGVEFEEVGDMFIDGTIPVDAFYKDGEVTLYNKAGRKNTPFKCTKEKLHTKPSITYRGGENFEFVD
ncbi:MAG: hypothetical protein RR516_03420 [Erysipelotrichaceae bacterium]